jgi:hypothetical protein
MYARKQTLLLCVLFGVDHTCPADLLPVFALPITVVQSGGQLARGRAVPDRRLLVTRARKSDSVWWAQGAQAFRHQREKKIDREGIQHDFYVNETATAFPEQCGYSLHLYI